MTGKTFHEIETSLEDLGVQTLREMVYQAAQSHVRVCELTSQAGDCSHIGIDEIRARVEDLDVGQMTAILASTAWVAVDVDRRMGA